MLAEERYTRVIAILRERGFAKVEELAKHLDVSDMTIRRDLEKCQEAGLLQRCHGGAILVGVNQKEVSFEDKSSKNSEVKKQIAQSCTGFVVEGMSVFLDAGTTTFEIAQKLRAIPRLTVVTNDIRISYALLGSGLKLLLLGGCVQKSTGSVIGQLAEQMIQQLSFDVAFLGANAINEQFEVMTPTIDKVFYKRSVLKNSASSYLAVDHSKFYRRALHRINCLSEYSGVVTDRCFNAEEQELIGRKEINIVSLT